MKPIKWKTVKEKAKRNANITGYNNYDGCTLHNGHYAAGYALLESIADNTFDWRNNLDKLQKLIYQRIDNWDIRCVRSLHTIFPKCLPKSCHYHIEMSNDGEWWIIK